MKYVQGADPANKKLFQTSNTVSVVFISGADCADPFYAIISTVFMS